MSSEAFDPGKINIKDLFRAKVQRRKELAKLPFEEKIQIVKRLQSVSNTVEKGKSESSKGAK